MKIFASVEAVCEDGSLRLLVLSAGGFFCSSLEPRLDRVFCSVAPSDRFKSCIEA
jgi:hypothetical protein